MAPNQSLAKVSSIVGVSAIIFLLDWFYISYITSYGLEAKTQDLMIGSFRFSVTVEWLPLLGVLLVSLVAWYEAYARIFPRRAGPEIDPLANMRLFRAVAFSVMIFVCVLYIPYLLGSNWFWDRLSEVSQVRGFGLALLHAQEPLMTLNPLGQYSVSEIVATAAMVFVAWAFGRVARRSRKLR